MLINGVRSRAFFDTSTSHSFISQLFASTYGIDKGSVDAWWVYALEHTISVKEECSACPIQVGDWIMPANLLVLSRLKALT